ncbi:MAG: response regulator [Bacteroidota bacterium]
MILIVDDKRENLLSLKALLQINLYEVEAVSSGEEALKKILKNDYSLIILDVQMPVMDGYEVAEAVTGLNKSKNIPIIFLSAVNIDKRFISKGYSSGGVDYITKPFDPDLLLLKVKTFCRLSDQTKNLQQVQTELKKEIEIRKSAEKALKDANNELEEKVKERTRELETSNAELQQYAYVASHDLQEPLRKITTFSKIIQERFLKETSDATMHMEKVITASERMRRLIDNLLDYSKLSGQVHFAATDLNQLLDDTISDLELYIKEKDALITTGKFPTIETIPGMMKQLFQNIINNALKFSKKDVRPVIHITGQLIAEKSFDAAPDKNGKYLRLVFEDNGIGFDEKYKEKIFVIFQRLHGKDEYSGTGIGLSIVKKIVEKHHGIITVHSKENTGTSFILVLPVKHENTVPAELTI